MKLYKRLIYGYLKGLALAALWINFRKRTIIGKHRLKAKRPTILVSNHPSTLLDPLNVAAHVPMYVHFLANAGLFQTRFGNWFFNTFYCIPIARKEDKPNPKVNNTSSFARCDEFLNGGGCLFIAPEGTSWMDRTMRPFKTGTARIAFSALQESDFSLDLVIQPVGVNYTAPEAFRSRVFMKVANPIVVKQYKEQYEKDPYQAVRSLTDQLEEKVRSMVIDTHSEEEDVLVKRLEEMQQNRDYKDDLGHFKRTKTLIEQLRVYAAESATEYKSFEEQVHQYFDRLAINHTRDVAISRKGKLKWLKLLFGLPFFLYGAINNALTAGTIYGVVRKLKLYVGYNASARMVLGLIVLPLFYGLQTWLVWSLSNGYIALAYLLSLIPFGVFAADFWKSTITPFIATWRFKRVHSNLKVELFKQSAEIEKELKQIQQKPVNIG